MNENARKVLEEAELGDTVAMMQLADWYETGEEDCEQSPFLSSEWMRKAAEHGNVDAMLDTARRYEFGYGPVKDFGKALDWYKKAFSNGDATACFVLGQCFEHGKHLQKSIDNAIAFYEEGAKRGSPEAQLSLGYKYLDGKGVPRDSTRAVELFEQAGQGGQGSAYTALAIIYLAGEVVPRNAQMAFDLLGQSLLYFDVDQTVAVGDAAMMYGFCLLTGTGTHEDRVTGKAILEKAAEAGNPAAKEILKNKVVKDPMMQIYFGVDGADLFKRPTRNVWDVTDLLTIEKPKSSFF